MSKPKISIITISYNSEKTIEETIRSVISQDYDNLEYIIIDGCSKDSTMDIVNKYRDKISYIVSEPDKGISDAFNKGIKVATGEIIGIINSDDLLLPNALKTVASYYSPDVDVYLGSLKIYNPEIKTVNIAIPSLKYSASSRDMIVCHPSTFIMRKTYLKYGFYKPHFRYMMDMDLLIRLSQGGANFLRIDQPLAQFTFGGITDNTSFKKGFKEYATMLKDNGASTICILSFLIRASLYRFVKNICYRLGIWNYLRSRKYKQDIG